MSVHYCHMYSVHVKLLIVCRHRSSAQICCSNKNNANSHWIVIPGCINIFLLTTLQNWLKYWFSIYMYFVFFRTRSLRLAWIYPNLLNILLWFPCTCILQSTCTVNQFVLINVLFLIRTYWFNLKSIISFKITPKFTNIPVLIRVHIYYMYLP